MDSPRDTPPSALARLEALDAAATPGPWQIVRDEDGNYPESPTNPEQMAPVAIGPLTHIEHEADWSDAGHARFEADAALIVALRNEAIPLLRAQAAKIEAISHRADLYERALCHVIQEAGGNVTAGTLTPELLEERGREAVGVMAAKIEEQAAEIRGLRERLAAVPTLVRETAERLPRNGDECEGYARGVLSALRVEIERVVLAPAEAPDAR